VRYALLRLAIQAAWSMVSIGSGMTPPPPFPPVVPKPCRYINTECPTYCLRYSLLLARAFGSLGGTAPTAFQADSPTGPTGPTIAEPAAPAGPEREVRLDMRDMADAEDALAWGVVPLGLRSCAESVSSARRRCWVREVGTWRMVVFCLQHYTAALILGPR
jgi:hypothetical protein